jgi:hypothetical protein
MSIIEMKTTTNLVILANSCVKFLAIRKWGYFMVYLAELFSKDSTHSSK